jgi:hypothetical protein
VSFEVIACLSMKSAQAPSHGNRPRNNAVINPSTAHSARACEEAVMGSHGAGFVQG